MSSHLEPLKDASEVKKILVSKASLGGYSCIYKNRGGEMIKRKKIDEYFKILYFSIKTLIADYIVSKMLKGCSPKIYVLR